MRCCSFCVTKTIQNILRTSGDNHEKSDWRFKSLNPQRNYEVPNVDLYLDRMEALFQDGNILHCGIGLLRQYDLLLGP